MKKLFLILFFLFPTSIFAARTRYISITGSNSADGLTISTPWQYPPGSPGCTSVCAALTPTADDIFILKGGDTFITYVDFSLNGTSGHPITYSSGDHSWFTGGSWTKPILDLNYTGSHIFQISNASYLTIDSIELKRQLAVSKDVGAIIAIYTSTNIILSNLSIHGWRLPGSGARDDGANGGIVNYTCANASTITLTDSVIENSENTGSNTNYGLAAQCIGTMTRVTIHDVHLGVLYTLDWNGGTMYNISYPSGNDNSNTNEFHGNGVYLDPATLGASTGYCRNSIFYNISSGANMCYLNARGGTTVYAYNDIFYGVISNQSAVSLDPYEYSSEGAGNFFIANILCYMPNSGQTICIHAADRGPSMPIGNTTISNIHLIGTGVTLDDINPANVTGTITRETNLTQTDAVAISQGYDQAHLWAPQNGSGSTIGTGTTKSSVFTTDILAVTRSGNWDRGPYQLAVTPNIYVSTTGNDTTGDGSFALPYLTFAKAKTIVSCGGSIIFRGGTYAEQWNLLYNDSASKCSSWNSPIIVTNYQSEIVTCHPEGGVGSCLHVIGNSSTRTDFYWKFVANHQNDIVFDCLNCVFQSNNGIDEQYSNFIWLENIEVKRAYKSGYIGGGFDWTMKNMNFHDNGDPTAFPPEHNIYHAGKRLLIDGGRYCGGGDSNIQIFNSGASDVDDNIIRNAYICSNNVNGLGDGGVILATGHRNQAYNNVIVGNKGRGITVTNRCNTCAIYNNTIVGNSQGVIQIFNSGGSTDSTQVKGNILDAAIENTGDNTVIGTNFSGTPSFTDPSSGDYTLLANSSAIGACDNLSSLSITGLLTDKNGTTRPNGMWSCGAFEGAAATRTFTVNISSGYKGDSGIAILMTGTNTNWMNGTSACSFVSNSGITVVSTVVANATMAICTINISASAPIGPRTIIMTTGGNTETLDNGFTILDILPVQTTRGSSIGLRIVK